MDAYGHTDKNLRSHSVGTVHSELWILAAFFVLFLIVNLLTASRYPIVWIDEVEFVDPAENLFLDHGFTSKAWPHRNDDKFFASYPPLYPFMLSAWINVSGFSPTGVRSLNYLLVILAAASIWLAVKRLKLVEFPWSRLLLVVLVLLGYGVSMSYRSGRPDMLTFLLAASAFLAYTHRSAKIRCALLTTLGVLCPFAGLQLLAFAMIFASLLLFYLKKKFVKEFICIVLGLGVGVISLIVVYHINGVLNNFVASVRPQTTVGLLEMIFEGNFSPRNRVPADLSLITLMLTVFLILSCRLRDRTFKWNSMLSFGLVVSFIVPTGMLLAGKFPTYYSWMVYVPLVVCVSSSLALIKKPSKVRSVVIGLLMLACLAGLPLQLAISAYDWEDRDHGPVEHMVEANLAAYDWVYCDYAAYYAVKKRVKKVFLPNSLNWLSPHQKEKISALVIAPQKLEGVTKNIGGRWNPVGEGVELKKGSLFEDILGLRTDLGLFGKKYHLRIYRRE